MATFIYQFGNSTSRRLGALLLFLLLSAPAWAGSGFYKNFVVLNSGRGNVYYDTELTDTSNPNFGGSLGSFDRTTGQLLLNGAEANTFENNGDDIQATRLYYRLYRQSTAAAGFQSIELGFRARGVDGNPTNEKWDVLTANLDLLARTNGNGTYVLDVYFEGSGVNNGDGYQVYDSRGGQNYRATFTVTGATPANTTWTGSQGTNWFNDNNWTAGVPTAITDALIPVGPINFPDITAGIAQTRNLTVAGTDPTNRAVLRLTEGELQVFGNFSNPASGYEQSGGFFVLARTGDQQFDGDVFFNVRVEGGGMKTLTNTASIVGRLTFVSGILQTSVNDPNVFNINLFANARIENETESSFLLGVVQTNRLVTLGATQDFGNIGFTLTTTGRAAGQTLASRLTGLTFSGAGSSRSVQRQFNLVPDVNGGLNATLVFRYLDRELNGIPEADLVLFQSQNSGATWGFVGKDGQEQNANDITKAGVDRLSFFTLGDRNNPLPVTLTSFEAQRQGSDALLRWATAQELNNAGFEVQVSTNGQVFRTLATVPAASANSQQARTYQYTDRESGKSGLRYYRLRQLDLNGQATTYGPRTVAFGVAARTVYPNPFSYSLRAPIQSAVAGTVTTSLLDGLGREVYRASTQVQVGAAEIALDALDRLPAGAYFLHLTLPDGSQQREKLLKR
ncbi:T9SS type A sorting domain-containing protein [Hymenobacter endophyticus]|uniref:T9SS type A sorting domain-containing protein n=1 Tax=Hymenobacter endophyticus TaxID=3076335 RepID=A0ABU3THW4_9BACT|nr:T9SS type A sorting domain-containing protein [Hymenobacter endophyticus]MDU0370960.1 T9SS type A sorting domain-containing protein [Hymenobacter endophyticus]